MNTASTLAMASTEAVRFVGMAGRDPAGEQLQQQLTARGVQPWLLHSASGASTAQCLCLVCCPTRSLTAADKSPLAPCESCLLQLMGPIATCSRSCALESC